MQGQLRAIHRGRGRGVASAFAVEHRLVAVLAQPCNQFRQKPLKLFAMRLRNNGDAGHWFECNGSGRGVDRSCVEQKLPVALGAGDRRRNGLDDLPAQRAHAIRDFVDRQLVRLGVAHDASLAHMLAPRLKLRLDQNHGLSERRRGSQDRLQQQRGRDERDVHRQQRDRRSFTPLFQCSRSKKPRIGALHQPHPRVVAQLHGNLAEARIDGGHVRRAMLQQAIGKPSRRGAHVQAAASLDGDWPMFERRGQLHSPAAHIRLLLAQQADRRASCAQTSPALSIFCSRTSTRPARISARARSRLGTRPRSTRSTSIRVLADAFFRGAFCPHPAWPLPLPQKIEGPFPWGMALWIALKLNDARWNSPSLRNGLALRQSIVRAEEATMVAGDRLQGWP